MVIISYLSVDQFRQRKGCNLYISKCPQWETYAHRPKGLVFLLTKISCFPFAAHNVTYVSPMLNNKTQLRILVKSHIV